MQLDLKNKEINKNNKPSLLFFVLFFFVFFFFNLYPGGAKAIWDDTSWSDSAVPITGAGMAVMDAGEAARDTQTSVKESIWKKIAKLYTKGGAAAFQTAVRTALNKIAYDTATWLGSGGEGQKPMFVTQGWGDYFVQLGDEAAGKFIEDTVNNWNNSNWDSSGKGTALNEKCNKEYNDCKTKCIVETDLEETDKCWDICLSNLNKCGLSEGADGVKKSKTDTRVVAVCQPSSIEAKIKISLGLVNYARPQAPNCTASALVKNWEDSISRLAVIKEKDFLDKFKGIFGPGANDLSIYYSLQTDMTKEVTDTKESAKTKLVADGGWLDMRDIAGNLTGLPGDAQTKREIATQGYISNMATFSGDALIDAANIFLNQLALTAFQKFMSNLGKEASNDSVSSFTNPDSDPNIRYGETAFKVSAAEIIEPDFSSRADYDILAALSICNNRQQPGPTECVIDDKLREAITTKKTVGEAIKEGYLHKEWLLTKDNRDGAYTLRNLQIMRKYRILPVAWELVAASREAALIDLISCFDLNDQYKEYTAGFDVRNQGWCAGLIDPNWVLKAPLNFCAKQGYGGQILNTAILPGADSFAGSISVTRADDYCADEKTCIKEKTDGSCEVYGYCQSEKRTWNFDSKSCQPIDNTCSAFVNADSGQSVWYLENTLDYGSCNADAVGCKLYSLFGTYASSTGQVNWSSAEVNTAYFNKQLPSCSVADEGCREMLRVKSGWGSNLIMGASFASDNIDDQVAAGGKINNYWPIWGTGNKTAKIINTAELGGSAGEKAILLETTNTADSAVAVFSNNANSLLPADLNIADGETYTFSADVYLLDGDKVDLTLGTNEYAVGAVSRTSDKNVWRHLSVTRSLEAQAMSEVSFQVVAYGTTKAKFAVRNLKLEMNPWDSGFSFYGSYKVYQKLIPPYLAPLCYVNSNSNNSDYRLRADAPAVCQDFARRCNRAEAGCEKYAEKSTGFSVAAQTIASDYCDSKCAGYNLYIARDSYFYHPLAEKIIPQKSRACQAEAVGCGEFTNLDEVAAGGEKKEYYSQLKQCIKPGSNCADFYTWVGTEESGYQLKSLLLKKDANGLPAVTTNDSTITAAGQCNGTDRFWNATASVCYVCKNGGTWNAQYQACLYQAIPQEGKKCSADQNGCREYNGSLGNSIRLVTANDFENNLDGWEGQCGDNAVSSQVVSTNNGQSLLYDKGANVGGVQQSTDCEQSATVSWLDRIIGSAKAAQLSYIRKVLGKQLVQGQSYSVKFTASAAANVNISMAAYNGQGELAYFNASATNPNGNLVIPGDNEWHTYELNLAELNHVVDDKEALIILASGDFYLDNLVFSVIQDRYYLIKNSSQVPDVCYYDLLDNYQGADYNLGCSLYNDRAGNSHYLRQFNGLCQDSAVGCELMVDTADSDNYKPNIWGDVNNNGNCDGGEKECISVSGDRFMYAIYDESRRCNSDDAGCSRLGEAASDGLSSDWSDVFKRQDPDYYDKAICGAEDAGCEAWQYQDGSGMSYFKNPGNNTCVYRVSSDPAKTGKFWYKSPVKRCDLDGGGKIDGIEKTLAVCANDNDCLSGACITDDNDYACEISYFKTIGSGGGGNQVPVPSAAVGVCNQTASGCTEYIDPISVFADNLIYNPKNEMGLGGWSTNAGLASQELTIEPNTLYIFSVSRNSATTSALVNDVSLNFPAGVSLLLESNNLATTSTSTLVISKNQPNKRFIFHSRGNTQATVIGGDDRHEIILKEALIDYQFKQNVDLKSCNGLVNFNNGCILFNERSVNGANGLLSLTGGWNALASNNGEPPALCATGNCSANRLIKVKPDRVCASWLDCLTYVDDPDTKERTCYALGECNSLNDKNECVNFVKERKTPLGQGVYGLANATGYSLLNQYDLAGMQEVGLNTEAHYDFEDASPLLTCKKGLNSPCDFEDGIVAESIVNSPDKALTDYPAEGKAYLRVLSSHQISPHSQNYTVSVVPNKDYYINYLVNTRGSGLGARIDIYAGSNSNGLPIFTATSSAPNGWERKVARIPGSQISTSSIQIYLGATSVGKSDLYVYFDDIHIEPVLKVSNNNYVAKECRLYPDEDSLSCTSKNSQVIKDGLVGYCLQHDPVNKNVCLLWYPIDQISASAKSVRSNLGYQGAFPLNYCTEANGNFTLVEKRILQRARAKEYLIKEYKGNDIIVGEPNNPPYPYSFNNSTEDQFESNDGYADPCYLAYAGDQAALVNSIGNQCRSGVISFNNSTNEVSYAQYYINLALVKKVCGDDGYAIWRHIMGPGSDSRTDTMICVPIDRGGDRVLSLGQVSVPSYASDNWTIKGDSGWYKYNGLAASLGENGGDNAASFYQVNEKNNADPAIRVFDYSFPTVDEKELKSIFSDDLEAVYLPTCNRFTQVVVAAGNNIAWTGRVSRTSAYPTSTPTFFRNAAEFYGTACYIPGSCILTCEIGELCSVVSGVETCFGACAGFSPGECAQYQPDMAIDCTSSDPRKVTGTSTVAFDRYGRNRELVPFGAATFPDGFNIFNSNPIQFRTRYSNQIDQTAFAGRPYGCIGGGCSNLGQCSLNPNILCILDDTIGSSTSLVNQRSCGAANGTCTPLWNGDMLSSRQSQNIFKPEFVLKTLFLKSFAGYKFNTSTRQYIFDIGYTTSDYALVSPISAVSSAASSSHLTVNDKNYNTFFRAVWPQISNMKLNGQAINSSSISSPGIYALTFNTTIDAEQQPLKDIIIDWGDGSFQSLVNQDHHPFSASPHLVYHYYKQSTTTATIKIKISDNWGFFCCSKNGSTCNSANCP